MSKYIRFGEHYHWAARILEFLDVARFAYEFGPPEPHRIAGIDAFVPLALSDIRGMARLPAHLRARTMVPTLELLSLADNKIEFYRYLSANGFAQNLPALVETPIQYPIVAKAASTCNGERVWIAQDDAQLRSILNENPPESLILSEYVPGTMEYAYHFLARNGTILWSGLVEHDHSDSQGKPFVRGQRGAAGASKRSSAGLNLKPLQRVVQFLEFTGTGCFDFKMIDGEPKIFELNPRPGYSIAFFINEYLDSLLSHLPVRGEAAQSLTSAQ